MDLTDDTDDPQEHGLALGIIWIAGNLVDMAPIILDVNELVEAELLAGGMEERPEDENEKFLAFFVL